MKKWWHSAIGYHIYPKSFQDSNHDGIGDINGIRNRLDYLKELGINVLWICPIFKSPMVDHGYDISDYQKIDPIFGTLEDLQNLITEAKNRNIKILLDLVVNHTSDQHFWFQEALKDPYGKYGKYYIFKKGTKKAPPNNWRSIFGGSAWEKVGGEESALYYLHVFTKEQPDLNWENPELRQEIYKMMRYWLDLGIAGFRVDAISHIKKNFNYINQKPDKKDGYYFAFDYFNNVEGINDFLSEMREETFAHYDCFTVGEVNTPTIKQIEEYAGEKGHFSSVFDFCHTDYQVQLSSHKKNTLEMVEELKNKLFERQISVSDSTYLCNIIENHDLSRAIDRFIPPHLINYHSTTMLAGINFFMKGIPFLYQGQEIGMRNFPKETIEGYKDPTTERQYIERVGLGEDSRQVLDAINITSREHSRTPMQWDVGLQAGFSTVTPWFEVNPNHKQINVKHQLNQESSILQYYKKMIALRKRDDLIDTWIYGNCIPVFQQKKGIIAYLRQYEMKTLLVIHNCNNSERELEVEGIIKTVLLNNYEDIIVNNRKIVLYAFQSLVLIVES